MELLKQGQYQVMSFVRQVIELFAAQHYYLDDLDLSKVHPFLDGLYLYIQKNHSDLISELETKKEMSKEYETRLNNAINEFAKAYK